MSAEQPILLDDFKTYYRFAPAALAIRECLRLGAVRQYELEEPILDVGCGDGIFARLAYPGRQTWGIDINPSEIQRAQATAAYSTLICGNVIDVDLPEKFFSSAIANCSLEHVPDLDGALANIHGSLKENASFVLIVPTPNWTDHLAMSEQLRKVGLNGLARAYGDTLDDVFHHVHLYDEATWKRRLAKNGFELVDCRPLVAKSSSWAFDAALYPSLLGYFTKKLTGRWVLSPIFRNLSAALSLKLINTISKLATDDLTQGSGEFVIEARRMADGESAPSESATDKSAAES